MKIWVKSFNGEQGVLALLDPQHIRLKIKDFVVTMRLPQKVTFAKIDTKLTKRGYKRLI